MKLRLLFIVFIFPLSNLYGQEFEYLGVLKLPDSTLITYKLDFEELDGKIKGYSYTDLNGENETKSSILGSYNEDSNVFQFRESELIYTKSSMLESTFCNVFFTGNMRKLNGKSNINGTFKGFYDDLTKCIDGEILMSEAQKIQKRNDKYQRKINRSSRVADSIKEKVNLDKMFNRYAKNSLKGGEKLNILWKDEYLKLIIWDDGEVDGDQIDLTINGNKILDAYSPVAKRKEIELSLIDPVNTISLKAINLGVKPPNTAKIQLMKKNGEIIDLASNLQVGEEVTFVFYKEKPKVKK